MANLKQTTKQPTVALFDLDYTLISADCTAHWLRFMLTRSWRRKLLIIALLPFIHLANKLNVKLAVRNSLYLWAATVGLGYNKTLKLRRKAARFVIEQKRVSVFPQGRQALEWHRQQGHQIIVITGALRWLARDICRALEIEYDVLLGSSDKAYLGGRVSDVFCYQENKVALLQGGGYLADAQVRYGYSDSAADIPLLQICQHRFLVNPKPKCYDRFKSVFGDSAITLYWATERTII
ncbi:HAD-IB family phosphatase [Alteromonas flava]|uniref:HAD-IB family phosphatase n=1 Tax=Alteromonas flava TaxID=2048003 RepID=UPI000C29265A|nr:HAD-IB family phosphatase [Alteromonas flava]